MSKKSKQVEVNEFDETIAASKSFFEKYQKQIVYGAGSILALIIAVLLINQFYITPRNQKANEALYPAEQAYRSGQYEKALNGEGEMLGFLAVADKYSCTKAGNIARLYAGICYAETEKYQEAVDILQDFDGCDDEMVSPSTIGLLANCYAQLGQVDKALEFFLKAAKEADNNLLSPLYLIQAAKLYESKGENEKALDCYNQIKEKYQQSLQYGEIDKYIEHLK